MKAAVATLLALFITCLPVPAEDWARQALDRSPRHLDWVTVKQGKRNIRCFIAYPEKKDKATAVVVIHEIYGLSDWIRRVSDEFAERGYIAIAPDLLSGAEGGGTGAFEGGDALRKAVTSLPQAQIDADLTAVTNHAALLPACNGKVAVAGFCWGGTQAFRFAARSVRLKGAFVFYGTAPTSPKELERIKCNVHGFYGEKDARVTATVPKTTRMMEDALKTYDPVVYKDAGHGFMRTGAAPNAEPANRKARDQAWERLSTLLEKIDNASAGRMKTEMCLLQAD